MRKNNLTLLACAVALALPLNSSRAITIVENFSNDPLTNGWSISGESLFHWNETNLNLEVTWDSSRPNSFFSRPLGMTLNKSSDFMLSFELQLSEILGGVNPEKPFPFQIAVGFFNRAEATQPGFIRGSGFESPDLVEFNYFPAAIFDPTISTVLISSSNEFSAGGFTFPRELATNALFGVMMIYTSADRTLRTVITSNGVPFGPVDDATVPDSFSDFSVDHLSVSSYSDVGQFPGFEGSVLAHGVVDNFIFSSPPPVTQIKAVNDSGVPKVEFLATTNWVYNLERTTNFQTWASASASVPGVAGSMQLQDTNPPTAGAFYRVQAHLP